MKVEILTSLDIINEVYRLDISDTSKPIGIIHLDAPFVS